VAAFGASRGYHRMACAIEDAGFEIRDSLMWLYGTGFPKSHDVSKGIDKAAGAVREVVGERKKLRAMAQTRFMRDGPAQDDGGAAEWEGWGTALKPAFEPIVLARKPLSEGTVAANVLRWRTGALNIDACRVETDAPRPNRERRKDESLDATRNTFGSGLNGSRAVEDTTQGRWPANVVHDGSAEVVEAFPRQAGAAASARHSNERRETMARDRRRLAHVAGANHRGDSGSAARFFYSAKASKADRAGSKHPTVKPIALMQWLARLITPPGGVVLDPFAGSGTTGAACALEGFGASWSSARRKYE
jgi:hypothetical protein